MKENDLECNDAPSQVWLLKNRVQRSQFRMRIVIVIKRIAISFVGLFSAALFYTCEIKEAICCQRAKACEKKHNVFIVLNCLLGSEVTKHQCTDLHNKDRDTHMHLDVIS